MNRRLRKKRFQGEFSRYGVDFKYVLNPTADGDALFDKFIVEILEPNNYLWSGGGGHQRFGFFVRLGKKQEAQGQLDSIRAWFASQPAVRDLKFSKLFDCDHGPFEEPSDPTET